MSLIDEVMEDYTLIDEVTTDDGYGGITTDYEEGATIKGAMLFNNSIESRRAQKDGVTSVYTLTTRKNVVLKYHQILKRLSDNKIFRVTSDGDDSFTPDSASLNMRQVSCEEWRL